MLPVELAHIYFPTGSPPWERHMLLDGQARRQAEQLNFARNAVIQQNFGTPTAGEIANLNVERRTPAIDGRDGVAQAHTKWNGRVVCRQVLSIHKMG